MGFLGPFAVQSNPLSMTPSTMTFCPLVTLSFTVALVTQEEHYFAT